jgi:hypothetical protein
MIGTKPHFFSLSTGQFLNSNSSCDLVVILIAVLILELEQLNNHSGENGKSSILAINGGISTAPIILQKKKKKERKIFRVCFLKL